MTDEQYRVVVDGIGRRTGQVASAPMDQDTAMAGLPNVLDAFAADINAGDIRVSVVPETDFRAALTAD